MIGRRPRPRAVPAPAARGPHTVGTSSQRRGCDRVSAAQGGGSGGTGSQHGHPSGDATTRDHRAAVSSAILCGRRIRAHIRAALASVAAPVWRTHASATRGSSAQSGSVPEQMIDFGRGVPGRGTFILIAIVIAIIVAAAFGYYTYSGSGINAHPNDGLDGAPGAGEPSQPPAAAAQPTTMTHSAPTAACPATAPTDSPVGSQEASCGLSSDPPRRSPAPAPKVLRPRPDCRNHEHGEVSPVPSRVVSLLLSAGWGHAPCFRLATSIQARAGRGPGLRGQQGSAAASDSAAPLQRLPSPAGRA